MHFVANWQETRNYKKIKVPLFERAQVVIICEQLILIQLTHNLLFDRTTQGSFIRNVLKK